MQAVSNFTRKLNPIRWGRNGQVAERPRQAMPPFGQWTQVNVLKLTSILEAQGYLAPKMGVVVHGYRNLVIPVRPSDHDLANRKNLKTEWIKLAENLGIATRTSAYAEWGDEYIYYFLFIPEKFSDQRKELALSNLPPGIIGQTEYRRLVVFEFDDSFPHVLVAGATGSGKSVTLEAIIIALTRLYSPEQLELIICDPQDSLGLRKDGRVGSFANLAHLVLPVATTPEAIRYAYAYYNSVLAHRVANRLFYADTRKLLVMISDELANQAVLGKKNHNNKHNYDIALSIGEEARKYGVHYIGGVRFPEEVDSRLFNNLNHRLIGFMPDNAVGARALGRAGYTVNRLLGGGDFLDVTAEVQRIQVGKPDRVDFDKLPRREVTIQPMPEAVEAGRLGDDLMGVDLNFDDEPPPDGGLDLRGVDIDKMMFYMYHRLKITEQDALQLKPLQLKRRMHEKHRAAAEAGMKRLGVLQQEAVPLDMVERVHPYID